MKYEQWRKNAIRFVAMTGYSFEQFDEMLPYFQQALLNTCISYTNYISEQRKKYNKDD